jgi:hypothetical protein
MEDKGGENKIMITENAFAPYVGFGVLMASD